MNHVGLSLSLSEDRLDLKSSNFFFVSSSEILFSVNSVFFTRGIDDNSWINFSTSKGFFKYEYNPFIFNSITIEFEISNPVNRIIFCDFKISIFSNSLITFNFSYPGIGASTSITSKFPSWSFSNPSSKEFEDITLCPLVTRILDNSNVICWLSSMMRIFKCWISNIMVY